MWFETLTGFPEESPQQVRENITVDGQELTSHVNGKCTGMRPIGNPDFGRTERTCPCEWA